MSSEPTPTASPVVPGQVRLRGVARRFKLVHERNATLKETVLRRRRTTSEDFWAVQGIDLDVAPGEALGIVGRNGSGKSTLLKLLAGIIPPNRGTVEIGGSVAAMLELGAGFHPDFTGRENVYMNGAIYGLGERDVSDRLDEIVAFAELEEFIDMPVRTYSSGMQMRLAFAVSSHVNPDVLLLDEVLAVGDESFQRKCIARLADYKRGGGTLVLVTHDPNSVEQMCDHAIVLADGKVLAEGAPAKVLTTYRRRLVADDRERDEAHPGEHVASLGEEAGDGRSWGDLRAQIREARLIGPEGPASSFVSGDPLVLEMDVVARERLDGVIYGMTVHSAEGLALLRHEHTPRRVRYERPRDAFNGPLPHPQPPSARGALRHHPGDRGSRQRLPLARSLDRVRRLPGRSGDRSGGHDRHLDDRAHRSGIAAAGSVRVRPGVLARPPLSPPLRGVGASAPSTADARGAANLPPL